MSKAKEEYEELFEKHALLSPILSKYDILNICENYIKELEESLEQLAEKHDKLHTEYVELKSENKEMKKVLKILKLDFIDLFPDQYTKCLEIISEVLKDE